MTDGVSVIPGVGEGGIGVVLGIIVWDGFGVLVGSGV